MLSAKGRVWCADTCGAEVKLCGPFRQVPWALRPDLGSEHHELYHITQPCMSRHGGTGEEKLLRTCNKWVAWHETGTDQEEAAC